MPRGLNKLTAISVRTAAPGKYSDGGGLWLYKRPDGGGQWFLRFTIHGRRREMGLGSISDVSLKDARSAADAARSLARANKDPIKERDRQSREAARDIHLLKDIALDAFPAPLRRDSRALQWFQ